MTSLKEFVKELYQKKLTPQQVEGLVEAQINELEEHMHKVFPTTQWGITEEVIQEALRFLREESEPEGIGAGTSSPYVPLKESK